MQNYHFPCPWTFIRQKPSQCSLLHWQPLPAHGSSSQKRRDSSVWSLVGTIYAHDTPFFPTCRTQGGIHLQLPKALGMAQAAGRALQPPSHQDCCQWPPRSASSSQPWRAQMPALDPHVPTSPLPSGSSTPRPPAAAWKWIWSCADPAALWDMMVPDHAWSSWIQCQASDRWTSASRGILS